MLPTICHFLFDTTISPESSGQNIRNKIFAGNTYSTFANCQKNDILKFWLHIIVFCSDSTFPTLNKMLMSFANCEIQWKLVSTFLLVCFQILVWSRYLPVIGFTPGGDPIWKFQYKFMLRLFFKHSEWVVKIIYQSECL